MVDHRSPSLGGALEACRPVDDAPTEAQKIFVCHTGETTTITSKKAPARRARSIVGQINRMVL
jgi:hypothetical protein